MKKRHHVLATLSRLVGHIKPFNEGACFDRTPAEKVSWQQNTLAAMNAQTKDFVEQQQQLLSKMADVKMRKNDRLRAIQQRRGSQR